MESVPVDVEEGSEQAASQPPISRVEIPPSGRRGAAGIPPWHAPSRLTSRTAQGAKSAGLRACLPPAGAEEGGNRKRRRLPSSDGGELVQNKGKQKKGKQAAGKKFFLDVTIKGRLPDNNVELGWLNFWDFSLPHVKLLWH